MKSGSLQRLKRAKQSDLLVVSLGAESWCEHAAKAGPSTVNVTNITNNFNKQQKSQNNDNIHLNSHPTRQKQNTTKK